MSDRRVNNHSPAGIRSRRRYQDRLMDAALRADLDTVNALGELQEPVTPEDALIARQDALAVSRAVDRLPGRYARVLRLYYGLGCEPHTCERVAEQLGVSKARVSQIVLKGCRLLRRPSYQLGDLADTYTDRHRHHPARRHDYATQAVLRDREEAEAAARHEAAWRQRRRHALAELKRKRRWGHCEKRRAQTPTRRVAVAAAFHQVLWAPPVPPDDAAILMAAIQAARDRRRAEFARLSTPQAHQAFIDYANRLYALCYPYRRPQ